jgi:hypothetical protein
MPEMYESHATIAPGISTIKNSHERFPKRCHKIG